MYSIDGVTWSTRSEELQAIIDRHSFEQAGFGADLKGEEKEKAPAPKPRPKKFNRVHNDDELDEIIDDDMKEEEISPEIDVDVDDEDEIDAAPKKLPQKNVGSVKPVKSEARNALKLNEKKETVKQVETPSVASNKSVSKPKAKPTTAKAKPIAKKALIAKKIAKPNPKLKPKVKKK